MTKPTKPTVPPAPSRANPGPVFSQTADTFAAFQAPFADYLDALAEFVDDRADEALAAALAGDLPSLAGQAGRFVRVNGAGTAAEFAQIPGIGSETVSDTTNLNTITVGGTYHYPTSATGNPLPGSSGTLLHLPTTSLAFARQVAWPSGAPNRMFTRQEASGVWTGWTEVTHNNAGEVSFFARNSAPDGWLKANGAAVSRTVYADLFSAIGVFFGAGDGSTTFNLPDLRGEFVRGWDDGRGVDTGRVFGSAQAQEIQSHSHVISATASMSGTFAAGIVMLAQGEGLPSAATGGTETRPRNVALLACIKF